MMKWGLSPELNPGKHYHHHLYHLHHHSESLPPASWTSYLNLSAPYHWFVYKLQAAGWKSAVPESLTYNSLLLEVANSW